MERVLASALGAQSQPPVLLPKRGDRIGIQIEDVTCLGPVEAIAAPLMASNINTAGTAARDSAIPAVFPREIAADLTDDRDDPPRVRRSDF